MSFLNDILSFGKSMINPLIDAGSSLLNTFGKAGTATTKGIGNLTSGNWKGALDEGINVMNSFGQGATDFSKAVQSIPIIGDALDFIDPISGTVSKASRIGKNLIGSIGSTFGYDPTSSDRQRDTTKKTQKDPLENMSRFPNMRSTKTDNIISEDSKPEATISLNAPLTKRMRRPTQASLDLQ